MKRHNLISLIGVLFILIMSMAMTGCATTGNTPLMSAVGSGDINAVKRLLNEGADVNAKDSDNWNALTKAARDGHAEIVKLLIEKGADVNAKAYKGYSALMVAALDGYTEIVKLLIEKGADIDYAITIMLNKYPWQGGGYEVRERKASAATAVKLLEKFAKKQEIASQPVIAAAKPSHEVSPLIKSDVDELPAIKAKPNKNSYAIVIGIENYRQKLPKADYAVADAKTMTEYLTKVMGYPEENVVTLTNEHAAKSDFEKYFEKWLFNNVEKDSSVFIYYSGHGAPNTKTGDAYLVPYDGDPSFIEQTGYSLKKLYESLNKLQAKEIIVALDSCFSGAGGKSVIAKGARPLVMNLEQDIKLSKNMIVMSASSGDQISSTYEEKGHGLFTYFMLKGIKDGITEIGELFDYLKPYVGRTARKVYNNEQTPQLIAPDKKKVFLRN
ncbi:MAG: ankyrin repeat domain-containing protein [Thermodesulfovibrionales bacterium]|nr:ankyrin repeat domain-containing protein [Thermodesulfovibrionales bacterium]